MDVLREPREVHGEQRAGRRAEFDGEITVADGVHGILCELGFAAGIHKAKQLGDEDAIQRQGGPGDGTAAERADVHARVAIPEAFAIAFEHPGDVGEEMMGEIDRLGALEMGVAAADEHVGMLFFAEGDEGALQAGDFTEWQRGDPHRGCSQRRTSRAT